MKDTKLVQVYTDGGARGNPGPAGAGAVILDHAGVEIKALKRFLGERTNNQAEYEALLMALEELIKSGIEEASIFADSELMVRQMTGAYRVKDRGLKPLYARARELVGKLRRCEFRHVRREHNQRADELANEAIDAGLGKNF